MVFVLGLPMYCFGLADGVLSKKEAEEVSLKEKKRQDLYKEIVKGVGNGTFLIGSAVVSYFLISTAWEKFTYNPTNSRALQLLFDRGYITENQQLGIDPIDPIAGKFALEILDVDGQKRVQFSTGGAILSTVVAGLIYLNYKNRTVQNTINCLRKIFNKG